MKQYFVIVLLFFSAQFQPALSEKNYFYILGSKAIFSDVDYKFVGNNPGTQEQKMEDESILIGFGKNTDKSIFDYDLAFEIDYALEYKGGDQGSNPCSRNNVGDCSLTYKDVINLKFLLSKPIGNLKPKFIFGISSAKIESITNFEAVNGTTNPNKLKDKREIAGLIGIGLDHEFSDNISIKTEFTHRQFKKAEAPVWGGFRQASTDDYNLNLLSIGIKKNF